MNRLRLEVVDMTIELVIQETRPLTEIVIDGIPLRETLRKVELPYAKRDGDPDKAGNYVGLPPEITFFPSRYLLGEPNPALFSLRRYRGRTAILGCDCGIVEDWPFMTRIGVDEATVTWGDFAHGHLDWRYDRLQPFVFDRRQYVSELAKGLHEAEW